MDNPCFMCRDRYNACWMDCERYKAWRRSFEEIKRKRKENKELNDAIYAVRKGKNRARAKD